MKNIQILLPLMWQTLSTSILTTCHFFKQFIWLIKELKVMVQDHKQEQIQKAAFGLKVSISQFVNGIINLGGIMAFPGTYNFSYYRGDTYEFVIRPKNANGTTFSLDDYAGNADFTIANRRGSTGTQVNATATVNTTTDIVTCTITGAQGRDLVAGTTYVYDVQIDNGAGVIFTLLTGSITVTDDVTGAV
jgi:hypothetical protein